MLKLISSRCSSSSVSNGVQNAAPRLQKLSTSAVMDEKKPFYKRMFGKTKEEELEEFKLNEEQEAKIQLQEQVELEEKAIKLRRQRNKSRLSASERAMLFGEAPGVGVQYQFTDRHKSKRYQAALFGMYGGQATGIHPAACWPSADERFEESEYDKVFYDGKNFQERLQEMKERQTLRREFRILRDQEVQENMAEMKTKVKEWKSRMNQKADTGAVEQKRRDRALADMRQKYGYDVDPNMERFAIEIEDRIKEIKKAEKLARGEAVEEKKKWKPKWVQAMEDEEAKEEGNEDSKKD